MEVMVTVYIRIFFTQNAVANLSPSSPRPFLYFQYSRSVCFSYDSLLWPLYCTHFAISSISTNVQCYVCRLAGTEGRFICPKIYHKRHCMRKCLASNKIFNRFLCYCIQFAADNVPCHSANAWIFPNVLVPLVAGTPLCHDIIVNYPKTKNVFCKIGDKKGNFMDSEYGWTRWKFVLLHQNCLMVILSTERYGPVELSASYYKISDE